MLADKEQESSANLQKFNSDHTRPEEVLPCEPVECYSITPIKKIADSHEIRKTQMELHQSPSSEDERVNSGNVSLPLEDQMTSIPEQNKQEREQSEEENNEAKQLQDSNDNNVNINTKTNNSNNNSNNDDNSSEDEEAVMLMGCVTSANEAIELIRKCQRNHCLPICLSNDNSKRINKDVAHNQGEHCEQHQRYSHQRKKDANANSAHNEKLDAKPLHDNNPKLVFNSSNNNNNNDNNNNNSCHDLPVTLQEFLEQSQCSVSLFITRSAVFADALNGFTNEAQREQKEENRLCELYMQELEEEQRQETARRLSKQKMSSENVTKQSWSRLLSGSPITTAPTMMTETTSLPSERASICGSKTESVQNAESISAKQTSTEIKESDNAATSLQQDASLQWESVPRLAKQQYFLFMRDKFTNNRSTPYYLRHKYPVSESYLGNCAYRNDCSNNNNKDNSSNNENIRHRQYLSQRVYLQNDEVAREWHFVWKQFKRDISREVFVVQESVINNADDASVIVQSYLEYAFDRGRADALTRQQNYKNDETRECLQSSSLALLKAQVNNPSRENLQEEEEEEEKQLSKLCEEREEEEKEEEEEEEEQTHIRNRDVFQSWLSAGRAVVKDVLNHAQAALPEFVVDPIRDVIDQMKNHNEESGENCTFQSEHDHYNNNSLVSRNHDKETRKCGKHSSISHLRAFWQAQMERREIKSIYPRSVREKGRKVFAAAREVVLAGQQSFLAFPYMLLYEQIGMHALASSTPLPSRNVTSSDEEESDEEELRKETNILEALDAVATLEEQKREYTLSDTVLEEKNDNNIQSECNENKAANTGVKDEEQDKANSYEYNKCVESGNVVNYNINVPTIMHKAEKHIECDEISHDSGRRFVKANDNHTDNQKMENLESEDEWSTLSDLEQQTETKQATHSITRIARTKKCKSRRDNYCYKRHDPLLIGEPAVSDLHKFCEYVKAKVQRKDIMEGRVSNKLSLFREDVDGSVFLIPTTTAVTTSAAATTTSNNLHITENELNQCYTNAEVNNTVTSSHKRGTRIHLYYSSLRGIPIVCVSKLFRLFTLSQSSNHVEAIPISSATEKKKVHENCNKIETETTTASDTQLVATKILQEFPANDCA